MRKAVVFSVVIWGLARLASAAGAPELAVLDNARVEAGQTRVATRIDVWEDGEKIRSSRYVVFVGTGRRSLALARSGRESGQKVLMLDDQFWLFLPASQRPIRITPMQKMLGEASIGDIASLRWQEDYRVVAREDRGDERHLVLEADRKGLSYQRVELIVRTADFAPLSAAFYLTSGKQAKTAEFQVTRQGGRLLVNSMRLVDQVVGSEVTEIHYLETEPVSIPERWFSPAYLARNRIDWSE